MKTTAITLFAALLFASCGNQTKKETAEEQEEETVEKTEEVTGPQLRHVVLFKFKETSSTEEVQQVEEAFNALPSKISEIKGYEWGMNNSPENLNKELTHCYLLTFSSEADRDTYLTHPDHVAFGDIVGPHIADVLVVDYWTK
jgi:thiamine biosynthesis lipoprotein ApbE